MKTAVITGASRGIGYATATLLANRGWNLVINGGHNKAALEEAAEALGKNACVQTYYGDLSLEEHGNGLIACAIDTFGHIDLLINNAGVSHIGLLSDMSAAQWHRVIQTNLDSVFLPAGPQFPSWCAASREGSSISLPCGARWVLPAKRLTLPPRARSTPSPELWPKNLPHPISPSMPSASV